MQYCSLTNSVYACNTFSFWRVCLSHKWTNFKFSSFKRTKVSIGDSYSKNVITTLYLGESKKHFCKWNLVITRRGKNIALYSKFLAHNAYFVVYIRKVAACSTRFCGDSCRDFQLCEPRSIFINECARFSCLGEHKETKMDAYSCQRTRVTMKNYLMTTKCLIIYYSRRMASTEST